MNGMPPAEPTDDDDERTTVVDRSVHETDNETVVVDRSARDEPVDNATIVVDRGAPDEPVDNETVVVDRSTPAQPVDNETIVVDRSAPAVEEDGTIVVDRSPAPPRGTRTSAPAPARRGRRRITLPPVEPGFGADPVEAVGPGAVSSYSPRPIAPPPAVASAVPVGADATRAPAPSMPSVGKRSQAFGLLGVAGFTLATAVSLVGLAAIVVSLVG